jgi:hypothetical protein
MSDYRCEPSQIPEFRAYPQCSAVQTLIRFLVVHEILVGFASCPSPKFKMRLK